MQGAHASPLQQALDSVPDAERCTTVADGHRNLEHGAMRLRDPHIAFSCEPIYAEWCPYERRPVVVPLPTDEWRDAAVNAVAAADQRRNGARAQAVAARAEHRGRCAGRLPQRGREAL